MSEHDTTAGTWYEATQVAAPERPQLTFDFDVDVCVVGAGLAGLTVAREVARRGWSVAVLEASRVAGAASGRNTGFVLPGFQQDVDGLVERIGLDHTKELWALSEQGLAYVRRTIEETGMPGVDPVDGWLHVSKTDDSGKESRAYAERLRWIGGAVEAWPTERVRSVLPNPRYFSAVHYPTAFHIHPLNYALGLAAAAEAEGARIFEHSPAVSIDPTGVRKRIVTPHARVRAPHVVLAGNVHLGALLPELSATLIPVNTFVMVTRADRPAVGGDPLSRRGQRHQPRRQPLPHRRRQRGRRAPAMVGPHAGVGGQPALVRARAATATSAAPFPSSARSRSRICGAARSAAPCTACRRSARSSRGNGWRAASAATASTPPRMAGELIARGIVEKDDTWRLFAPYELVWAGGVAGRAVAQRLYWTRSSGDKVAQAMARRRARSRERKAARQAHGRRRRSRGRRRSRASPPLPSRHKRQPLKQMHVLLVLEQRAVQRRDQLLRIALAQQLRADVLDHQQLQPIQKFRGRGLFLDAGHTSVALIEE